MDCHVLFSTGFRLSLHVDNGITEFRVFLHCWAPPVQILVFYDHPNTWFTFQVSQSLLNVISLQDVIGGTLISAVLLMLLYPAWDTIDHLLLTSPFCPLFSIVVPLVLCYNYPKLDYYSPTRGDTTTILGAAAGATVGFWLNNQYAAPAYTSKSFQPGFPLVTSTTVLMLARFFVGILVVLLTRWVMKSMVLGALGYRYQFPLRDLEARRRLEVEVPYKFVTYSSVGFTATVIVPLLHELLGLM